MRADKDGSNVTTLVSSNDAAQVGLFSFIVGETEIYYLIAFGSSPVDAGI